MVIQSTNIRQYAISPSEKSLIAGKPSLASSKSLSDPALIRNDTTEILPDKQNKVSRKVQFDDVLLTKIIPTEEDIDPAQMWFSTDELKETAKEVEVLVRKFRQQQQPQRHGKLMIIRPTNGPLPPELRGLEDMVTPQRFVCRRNRISQVIKGVQQEQKKQQDEAAFDPLLIAVRCQEVSKISQQLALQRARLDAREVAQFLNESG
jgi:hypothetical protein